MAPLISLIITTYNDDRNYLQAAIQSVLAQTYPNFELLVWDDGSTSGNSVDVARDYAQRDHRVRVIEAEHRGRVGALAGAIAQTTGLYLGWVDHDDLLHPSALEQTLAVLDAHPTTGMVYTDYLNIDEQGQVLGYGSACQIPYSPERLLVDFMTFHFRLIRRSIFEQAGGLDTAIEFAEDYDLCLRLSEITEIRQLKEPLYYYRLHGSNTSVRYRIEQVLRSRLAVKRALRRRGLSDRFTIDVELPSGRFILRQRATLPLAVTAVGDRHSTQPICTVQPEPELVVPLFSGTQIELSVTPGWQANLRALLPLTWQHTKPRLHHFANWKVSAFLASLPLVGLLGTTIVQAQPVSNSDSTGTIVSPSGNQFDITGGTQSGNNLFHSFEQFGLNQGQIANFLSNTQIQNILARVTGSNPSVINGLIQVTGSNANLFLLNPAGIIFGNNASLNVPGSFTATTASSIGIGNSWFNATGSNNYANLSGTPNSFAFPMSQPGAIVNAGNLAVPAGQTLSLIGGTVINTGTLSAPGGEVTVSAVPGQNLVRVNQSGSVLSLEFQPLAATTAATPLSLPQLLTGGNLASATGLTVNPNGTVQLTSSGTVIPTTPGTAIVSGNVNVASDSAIGGRVNVVGNQVGLVGATINASGLTGGGTVRIGGDYQGQGTLPNAIQTIVAPDSTINADATQTGDGGRVIIWSDQSTQFFGTISARGGATAGNGGLVEVSGKENLLYRGNVNTTAPNGMTGTLLLDPSSLTIIDGGVGTLDGALPNITFATPDNGANTVSWQQLALSGNNIVLQATGNITINSITGATPGVTTPGVATLNLAGGGLTMTSSGGAVTFQTLTDTIQTTGGFINISGTSLSLGNFNTSVTSAIGTATAGAITLTSTAGSTTAGILDSRATANSTFSANNATGGNVIVSSAGDITLNRIIADGVAAGAGFGYGATARAGDVTLATTGAGAIRVTGTFTDLAGRTASISAIGQATGGGTNTVNANQITITHGGGSTITPTNQNFTVGDASVNGTAGVIDRGGANFVATGSSFAVAPTGNSVSPATGITINSVNTPPEPPTANSPLTGAEQDQTFTFSFGDLALSAVDVDTDNRTFIIASVSAGVTLTVNGNPVVPGTTTISAGDTLTFQGPAGASGLLDAFTVIASDRVSNSSPTPVQVQVKPPDIPPPDDPPPEEVPPDDDDDPEDQPNPCALTSCQTIDPPDNLSILPDTVLEPPSPESNFTNAFAAYLGIPQPQLTTIDQQREIALEIERATGIRPAFVYVSFIPEFLGSSGTLGQVKEAPGATTTLARGTDQLEVLVVTARGPAIRRRIAAANRSQVMALVQQFREQVADPRQTRSTDYQANGYQLYQWLIAPVAAELQARGIGNLVFMMDEGLRSLPVAALYDGKRFLIEDYSVGLMPSLSLTNTLYKDIRDTGVLSLGISESTQEQPPLPAVPIELSELREQWTGQSYLNTNATIQTLKLARQQRPFGVIHLATHADFQPGSIANSYVQLWNEKLHLNQVRELGWNDPQIELLVLSACATALGDRDAELGFAGLAVQTGVKSALASLWYVSDIGTTSLMSRFYQDLRKAPIKAEALRQAQLAMLQGKVFVDENGLLQGIDPDKGIPLPEELAGFRGDLVHPYYWSAFTIIGNPW